MTTFKVTFHQDPSEEGSKAFEGITGTLAQCVLDCTSVGFEVAKVSFEQLDDNIITLFKNDGSGDFATIELV